MRRVLVTGGGAAGVCAAIAAAERGARVTVLERNRQPMKKLRASGNGRGNLMNAGAPVYYGGEAFALRVLESMPLCELRAFFERVGVSLTTDDEGRVYPASFMASVAAEALSARLAALRVEIITDARADAIEPSGDGFVTRGLRLTREADGIRKNGKAKAGAVTAESPFEIRSDSVIVAVGGAASPAFGTDGSGYSLLASQGHRLVAPRPALCALESASPLIRGLAGQRVRALLRLADAQGAVLHFSRGEALFTEYGVSGIAAMQLARFFSDGCALHIDMREAVTGERDTNALEWLMRRAKTLSDVRARDFLTGAASRELALALLCAAGVENADCLARELPAAAMRALASAIDDFSLPVSGTRGFEQAQVTAGGISTEGFDPATMESRLRKGIYAAGEALDVDGDCGGFNLMFAFASGLLAGRAAGGAE